MNNKIIDQEMLICQCLSLLPLEDLDCPLIDYGRKLTTKALLKIFVAAQLDQWSSYSHIEEKLRAYPKQCGKTLLYWGTGPDLRDIERFKSILPSLQFMES